MQQLTILHASGPRLGRFHRPPRKHPFLVASCWEAACSAHHAPAAHFFDLGGPSHYSGNYLIGFEHCAPCALGGGKRRTGVEPTPTLEEAASMGPWIRWRSAPGCRSLFACPLRRRARRRRRAWRSRRAALAGSALAGSALTAVSAAGSAISVILAAAAVSAKASALVMS